MTDEQLIGELRFLGIDGGSYRVISLLPLVQVAWADGAIQRAERALILETAERRGILAGDGGRIVEQWLANAPTDDYVLRGRRCLVALAERGGAPLGDGLGLGNLTEVVDLCEAVAKAAGGLFGLLFAVDARERAAIEEIATALREHGSS